MILSKKIHVVCVGFGVFWAALAASILVGGSDELPAIPFLLAVGVLSALWGFFGSARLREFLGGALVYAFDTGDYHLTNLGFGLVDLRLPMWAMSSLILAAIPTALIVGVAYAFAVLGLHARTRVERADGKGQPPNTYETPGCQEQTDP